MAIFKKSLRLFAAVLACAVFAGTASADVLYLGIGGSSSYAPDRFGLIRGKEAPTKDVVTGLGGSGGAKAFSFKNASGSPRVAVTQYSYSSGQTDTIDIYDPTDWSEPINEIGAPSSRVTNARGLACNGKYIYICDFDTATIARFDTTDDKYECDKSKSVPEAPAPYNAHCEGIVAYGGYLYVIVTYSDSAYTDYLPSRLLKYDADLNLQGESITLNSKNTEGGTTGAYMLKGDNLYITSIGGSQGPCNHNSMIEKVDLSKAAPSSEIIISNDALLTQQQREVLGICASADWSYNFTSLYVDDSGNLYIGMNGYDNSWTNYYRIVIRASETELRDPASLTTDNVVKDFGSFSLSAYVSPHMSFDTNNARLYFGAGEGAERKLFFYDGLTWGSYSETDLGAPLADFCVLLDSTSPAPSGSGGSGGCNAGFGALVLVVIALGAAKRRK